MSALCTSILERKCKTYFSSEPVLTKCLRAGLDQLFVLHHCKRIGNAYASQITGLGFHHINIHNLIETAGAPRERVKSCDDYVAVEGLSMIMLKRSLSCTTSAVFVAVLRRCYGQALRKHVVSR